MHTLCFKSKEHFIFVNTNKAIQLVIQAPVVEAI